MTRHAVRFLRASRIPQLVARVAATSLCLLVAVAPAPAKDPPRAQRATAAPSATFASIAALQSEFDAAVEKQNYDLALSYGSLLENAIVQYFGKGSLEHALVLNQIGLALNAKGAHSEAIIKCRQALTISEARWGSNDPALKDVLECLADAAERGNDAKAAIRWYERIASLVRSDGNLPGLDLTVILPHLGSLYRAQGMHEQAVRLYPRIIALFERMPLDKQSGALDVQVLRLADSLKELGRQREALKQFERALALREQFEGKDATSLTMILVELGQGYVDQKDYDRAVLVSQRAVKLLEADKTFGPEAPFLELPLTNLSIGHLGLKHTDEAITTFERVLRLREVRYGRDNAELVSTLSGLLHLYGMAQRYAQAEATVQRVIKLRKSQGAAPHELIANQTLLGELLQVLGRYSEAEAIVSDFLSQLEAGGRVKQTELIPFLDRLANLSMEQARFSEAGRQLQRALSIAQSNQTTAPAVMVHLLNSYGLLFLNTERKDEARIMFERAYALQRKLVDSDESVELLSQINNRATTSQNPAEAKQLLEAALRIAERNFGSESNDVASVLINLAVRHNEMGEFAAAESLLDRAIEIRSRVLGANSPELVIPLIDLAYSHRKQQSQKAVDALQRALSICDASLPEYHPLRVAVLDSLSAEMTARNNYDAALRYGRSAAKLVLDHSASELSTDDAGSAKTALESRIAVFRNLAIALTLSSRTDRETYEQNGAELFEVAQWVSQSSASIAMKQMAVRLAVDNPDIAQIVRERQDALASRDRLRGEFTVAMGKSRADLPRVTEELRKMEDKLLELNRVLKQRFPAYFSISGLKPGSIADVQRWLKADEALVLIWQIKDDLGLVFGVSSDGFEWEYIHIERLDDRIKAFRAGLVGGTDTAFDPQRSYELYQETLGKVDEVILKKSNLLIAPTGLWAALPFHLLVTDPPAPTQGNGQPAYADVQWLIKRQAISVLPSVSSLELFGSTNHGNAKAPLPLIGFGNPVFGRPEAPIPASKPAAGGTGNKVRQTASRRSYGEFWKGAEIDRQKLSSALPPLPDTQEELTSVAKSMGSDATDLFFGTAANETAVKHVRLSEFQVVYFATHGLVAGDVKGVGEPSLALSLPKVPSELDDGLLTSSEISRLKLNADWVVLSACNTLSADEPGGEALSGLARAFFYAGARSVLASHWAVESEAAVRLTTTTFRLLQRDPQMRRAEALRQAMLKILSSDARSSNPGYWGPFSLIGH